MATFFDKINSKIALFGNLDNSPVRLNKQVISNDIEQDDENVLFREQSEIERRKRILTKKSPEDANLSDKEPVLRGRGINESQIYATISRRFHSCLYESATDLYSSETETLKYGEIIKSYCVHERLTLYNYLRQKRTEFTDLEIKQIILNEYAHYFKIDDLTIHHLDNRKLKNIYSFEFD